MFRASSSDDYIVSVLVQNVIWIAIVLDIEAVTVYFF